MKHTHQQEAKRGCHRSCREGNPNRDYICKCRGCKGKAHGSHSITLKYLIEKLDHKLMDPSLSKGEFNRWLQVQERGATASASDPQASVGDDTMHLCRGPPNSRSLWVKE